jgi:hypothetical protein
MKKTLLLALAILFATGAMAQYDDSQDVSDVLNRILADETPRWRGNGDFSVTASQVSLTNWAAGGENAVAGTAMFNYSLDYEKSRSLWMNRLELGYGLSKTESQGVRKNTDRIYFNSVYGYEIVEHWYASFFVNFQTQFAKGYNYPVSRTNYISRFMAPGYLSLGPGITWMPNSWFIASFSPATWRGTFVMDDYLSQMGAYGVTPGKRLRNEFGADLKLVARTTLWNFLSVYSRLDLFSNYLHKPQNIVVHWDTILSAQINKWLSANLTFNLIYDDNVRFVWEPGGKPVPKVQLKELFGLGFMTSF